MQPNNTYMVYGLLPDANEHDDAAVTEIGCSRISGLW
jgi:hypothetical protein